MIYSLLKNDWPEILLLVFKIPKVFKSDKIPKIKPLLTPVHPFQSELKA